MSFARNLPFPKRLSPQVWLLTIPGALVSFERRQALGKLPIGPGRFAGVPLVAFGVGIIGWTWRESGIAIKLPEPLESLGRKPALIGGFLALAGVGVFLRSPAMLAYAASLAVAAATEAIEIEEPTLDSFAAGIDLEGV